MKQVEVVAAVVCFEGKILCTKRKEGPQQEVAGKFEFPGGKVEPGESFPQALKRELEEELEIRAEIREEDYLISVRHCYTDLNVIMHCYYCRPETDHLVRKEHTAHIWVRPEELGQLDWAAADIPVMNYLRDRLQAGEKMPEATVPREELKNGLFRKVPQGVPG